MDDILAKNARVVVYRARRQGVLVSPNRCGLCGANGYVVAHHDDYSKPLDVRWLCKKCHMCLATPVHKKLGRDKGVPSNNHHKDARNSEIIGLFRGGLTHREIAERIGMKISAVSMAISRWNDKLKKGESKSDDSNQ